MTKYEKFFDDYDLGTYFISPMDDDGYVQDTIIVGGLRPAQAEAVLAALNGTPPPQEPDKPRLALPEPLAPDVVIYRAGRGWMLRYWDATTDMATDDAELLWLVAEQCCSLGSRYDAKRLFIGYRPGDKHHDNHDDRSCAECDCQCEPPYRPSDD